MPLIFGDVYLRLSLTRTKSVILPQTPTKDPPPLHFFYFKIYINYTEIISYPPRQRSVTKPFTLRSTSAWSWPHRCRWSGGSPSSPSRATPRKPPSSTPTPWSSLPRLRKSWTPPSRGWEGRSSQWCRRWPRTMISPVFAASCEQNDVLVALIFCVKLSKTSFLHNLKSITLSH